MWRLVITFLLTFALNHCLPAATPKKSWPTAIG